MNELIKEVMVKIHSISPNTDKGFDVELFKKQGEILSECEDDYEGRAYFSKKLPNYDCMSEEQLRSYISWRTNLRKGKVSKIKRPYMHLYMYELINSIGVKNADEGFEKLVDIWRAYSVYTENFDEQMKYVLENYYIVSRPKQSFAQLIERYDLECLFGEAAVYETGIDYFEIEKFADYRFQDSALYRMKYVPIVAKCFNRVLKNLMPLFELYGMDICSVFGYRDAGTQEFVPFEGVIYKESRETNTETALSPIKKYRCTDGKWEKIKVNLDTKPASLLSGYIIRRIVMYLREMLEIKTVFMANTRDIEEYFKNCDNINKYMPLMVKDKDFENVIVLTIDKVMNNCAWDMSERRRSMYSSVVYSAIREMRKTAYEMKDAPKSERFMTAARIFENLEDKYKENIYYESKNPQYEEMTSDQLRYYLNWRSEQRRGEFKVTYPSYIRLYIKELLNGIGIKDKYDEFKKLVDILLNHCHDKSARTSAIKALKTCYVYGAFKESFYDLIISQKAEGYFPELVFENSDLRELASYEQVSSYKFKKSVFYTLNNSQTLEKCFSFTMDRVLEYFKKCNINLRNIHEFVHDIKGEYGLLSNIVYNKPNIVGERKVMISSKEKYTLADNEIINAVIYDTKEVLPSVIGYIIKRVETNLRHVITTKYVLQAELTVINKKIENAPYYRLKKAVFDPEFTRVIDESVKLFFAKNPRNTLSEVSL